MPYYKKNVSFQNFNNKSSFTSLKKINIFNVFNQEEIIKHNVESSLPPIDEIIWGKGFKSSLNGSWFDKCEGMNLKK